MKKLILICSRYAHCKTMVIHTPNAEMTKAKTFVCPICKKRTLRVKK